jgi:multidrug resistance efflux pump
MEMQAMTHGALTDIVARLHEGPYGKSEVSIDAQMREAADEIERLRAVPVNGDLALKAAHADCDRYRAEIKRLRELVCSLSGDGSR